MPSLKRFSGKRFEANGTCGHMEYCGGEARRQDDLANAQDKADRKADEVPDLERKT